MELSFDLPDDTNILQNAAMPQGTGPMEALVSSQAEVQVIDMKKVNSNNLNEDVVDSTQA
eukprot:10648334-Ditylum_brightwellii.AAC.1